MIWDEAGDAHMMRLRENLMPGPGICPLYRPPSFPTVYLTNVELSGCGPWCLSLVTNTWGGGKDFAPCKAVKKIQ